MYLTQALHRSVQQQPNAVYSIYAAPGIDRVMTVAETHDRVSRIAGGLRRLGVGPGDRVALLGLNTDTYLQLLLAVPWADAVMVPVNTRWSPAEIAFSLEDSGVHTLIVDDTFAPMVPALRAEAPGLRTVIHAAEGAPAAGLVPLDELLASDPIPDAHRSGEELAGIFYTGGTTGFPKGVMLTHRNLLVSAMGYGATGTLPVGGRTLHVAPIFHLAALAMWASTSLTGAAHVMVPGFDPAELMRIVERHRVTSALLVPTMIQMLVDHPQASEFDLASLEILGYGASPISEAVLDRARKVLPTTKLQQGYGMTELAPIATVLRNDEHDDPVLRRSAGRAAPHALVKVVDPDDNEVPRGTVGEIVCAGEHVMAGYWNRPEETAQALRGGWMHTGDGGYMDEAGYVYVVDRIKDMIITGGENVYSAEVENAIASHPAVAQCAVIGLPDDQWGERVHAVVMLAEGAELTTEELRDHCRSSIAGYKCPRSMEVVGSFPTSAAGKILKRELRAARQGGDK